MSDKSEVTNNLESAIHDALAAATGVTDIVGDNIVRGLARMYSGHPLVAFFLIAGGDVNDNPNERLDLIYDVRGISTVSPAQAATLAGAAREALDRATFSVSGYTNILTRSEGFISLSEFRIQPAFESWHSGFFLRVVLAQS
jgi:hypothetical protein